MLPLDKLLHLLAGVALSAFAMPFGIEAMVAAPIVVGALQELYDATGRGNVEAADFLYTVAGGAAFIGWTMVLMQHLLALLLH